MGDEPKFERAKKRESDPVGSIGTDWGFWDETWSQWHGGYADEQAARDGLKAYALSL